MAHPNKKRKSDNLMDYEETRVHNATAEKSDIIRVDILSLNGKSFDHKFTANDVKELWAFLGHDRDEVIGQSSSKISSKVLRVNIQLTKEVSIKEVSPVPDFLFEKSSAFQNYSYECKIVGLGSIKEAQVGDTVEITVRRVHFRIKPDQAAQWISKFGQLVGSPRYNKCVYLSEWGSIALIQTSCWLGFKLLYFPLNVCVVTGFLTKLLIYSKFYQNRNSCWLGFDSSHSSVTKSCWLGYLLSLFYSIFIEHIFQLYQGQGRTKFRGNLYNDYSGKARTRMAANVRMQSPDLLPRHANPVQQLLAIGPLREELQERQVGLEGVHQVPLPNRKFHKRNVWNVARGTTKATSRTAERRHPGHPQLGGRPSQVGGAAEEVQRKAKAKSKESRTPKVPTRGQKSGKQEKVIFWNCRGGIRSKIDVIQHYALCHAPKIFFICEANIKSTDDVNSINVKNYSMFHTAFEGGVSRLACYIELNSGYKVTLDSTGCEILVVENDTRKFVGVYRPFTYYNGLTIGENLDKMLTVLKGIDTDLKDTIIGGDFNLDYMMLNKLDYANRSQLLKLDLWSIEVGLVQHIKINTRRRTVQVGDDIRLESACLDHLYGPIGYRYDTMLIPGSDHDAVVASWIEVPFESSKIKARAWNNYSIENIDRIIGKNYQKFQEIVEGINIHDVDDLAEGITRFQGLLMDKLCPYRIFVIRRPNYVVDNQIEKLKKRRNRKLKAYWKEERPDVKATLLDEADELSKSLKQAIKRTARRRIQVKASSPDSRKFWESINEARGNFKQNSKIELDVNGVKVTEPHEVANHFADFFYDKAQRLSSKTVPEDQIDVAIGTQAKLIITEKMIEDSLKGLKNKKSFGIDGIPLCVVRDTYQYLKPLYKVLMNLCTEKMPSQWKMARVLPLHKKGSKSSLDNYRPISNLCSMDKVFEKIILNELDRRYPGLEGPHQHGFKRRHSTVSAMLEIQSQICSQMEARNNAVLYSVDLSAAFDLLRPKTFWRTLKDDIDDDLMSIIMDFLSERKMLVEVDGLQSKIMPVPLGCVQGSILGPKLFSLYMKNVPQHVEGFSITSYADDTYVLVSGPTGFDVKFELERCIKKHTEYLGKMGMVVNIAKTEAIQFTPHVNDKMEISVEGETFKTSNEMKVLGVIFDDKMKWTPQVNKAVSISKRLNSSLKLLRSKLTRPQFLKVMTTQYYSCCFYGSPVWLNGSNPYADLRRLNALHYRSLRIAVRDYKRRVPRSELDLLGRARPTTWSRFQASSIVIKTMNYCLPERLYNSIKANSYVERRRMLRPKFWNKSNYRIGKQALQNRAGELVNDVNFNWSDGISDDALRVNLKRHYQMK